MPKRELFLAPQYPSGDYPEVTQVRSTLLAASLQGVRHMGWEARYFAALPRELHSEIELLTAGAWMPLALGVAHYTACDAMNLSSDEMKEMGRQVSLRTQKTFVGTVGSIAAGAGATPWHIFQHGHRIWGRIFDGGDHVAYKIGPKDIDIVCMGCPLLRIRYFRTAMGAYYAALAGVLASTVHWHELPDHRGDEKLGLRVSWV
ncbi:MAG TPA: hypothetical protein VF765_24510 [Polyangiaceae bacterium]